MTVMLTLWHFTLPKWVADKGGWENRKTPFYFERFVKKIVPEIPEDMIALFKKYASIKKHLEANKHDETAKRGLLITESKINKLTKYYKRTGRISEAWKFDAERTGFFAE